MSLESAKAFVERIKTDEDFRNKVNKCQDQETRKALVMSAGYNFTKDDIEILANEISEEDLSAVTGGIGPSGLCLRYGSPI